MQPLPLNFPQDFLPERRLLARLLSFAAENGSGDKIEIGAKTDIPTGRRTGKVEPMIHYARGMGLIQTKHSAGHWQLGLSALGQVVANADPYLSERLTLWLLHLLLCRRRGLGTPAIGIADAWFALFGDGSLRLGNRFAQGTFLDYLTERHGSKGYLRSLAGLVPRSYLEPGCFGPIGALVLDSAASGPPAYLRRSAPADRAGFPAYTAYLYIVWDELFAGQAQLPIDEFFVQSRCLAVMGWDRGTANRWLDWMADHGQIQIDRQTGSALVLRLRDTRQVVAGIYDGLT